LTKLDKHVKAATEEIAEAECSLVPTHARGAHLVGRYIKDRRADQQYSRGTLKPAIPPFVLRLEGLPATPACLARIRRRVEELNRQLQQSEVPVRLRVM
jgi:hypothetical protein